eukprot:12743409-Prorocentrum_lima.AAC.1
MDRSLSHSLSRAALALGLDNASFREQERATALVSCAGVAAADVLPSLGVYKSEYTVSRMGLKQ